LRGFFTVGWRHGVSPLTFVECSQMYRASRMTAQVRGREARHA
jgi:hypothetical protein